jgi:hypothetical protein
VAKAAAEVFGAAFAMLVVVLAAFRGARLADFSAGATDHRMTLRAAAHERGGRPSNVGAIDAKTRALRPFAEALICAVLAFLGTTHAGVDTALVFLMCHFIFLVVIRVSRASVC